VNSELRRKNYSSAKTKILKRCYTSWRNKQEKAASHSKLKGYST